MPFDESFRGVHSAIERILEEHGFEAKRADDFLNHQAVMQDIVVPLAGYDLVIADLTDLNPNVMYEVGLAHAFNTPVLIITQDLEGLPFDLRPYRALSYSPTVGFFEDFQSELAERLANIRSMSFGSPVSDHLGIKVRSVQCDENEASDDSPDEGGFDLDETPGYFDHLETIEQGLETMTDSFAAIGEATSELGPKIASATESIETHEGQSQRTTIQQARAVARMAADALKKYGDQISEPRSVAADKWKAVDASLSAVLNWQADHLDISSRADLIESLAAFDSAADTAAELLPVIKDFRVAIRSSHGVDRGLNRQIDLVTRELDGVSSLLSEIIATLSRAHQFRNRLLHEADAESPTAPS